MKQKEFKFELNTIKQLASIQHFYKLIGLQDYIDNLYYEKLEEAKKDKKGDAEIREYIKENLEDGIDLVINTEDKEAIRRILIDTYTRYDVKFNEQIDEFEFYLKPKHKQHLSTIFAKAIEENINTFAPHSVDDVAKSQIVLFLRTREEVEALKDAQIINQGEIIDEQLPRMTKLAEELKAEKEEEKK